MEHTGVWTCDFHDASESQYNLQVIRIQPALVSPLSKTPLPILIHSICFRRASMNLRWRNRKENFSHVWLNAVQNPFVFMSLWWSRIYPLIGYRPCHNDPPERNQRFQKLFISYTEKSERLIVGTSYRKSWQMIFENCAALWSRWDYSTHAILSSCLCFCMQFC